MRVHLQLQLLMRLYIEVVKANSKISLPLFGNQANLLKKQQTEKQTILPKTRSEFLQISQHLTLEKSLHIQQ